MCLHLIESRWSIKRLIMLTADIWLWAECGNTIRDRSKVQLTNYDTRESGASFFTTARQYPVWRRLHANHLVVTKIY